MSGYKKLDYRTVHNDFLFLKEEGLKKHHKILDIGCGGGRLGNNLISYLDKRCYYGFDKETYMINYFKKSLNNILKNKEPNIFQIDFNSNFNFDTKFDFVYAYSVLTHNIESQFIDLLKKLRPFMKETTKIYFTFLLGEKYYVTGKHRRRLNEYRMVWYTFDNIKDICKKTGYSLKFVGDDTQNWEKVKRGLYDKSISTTNKKYGNGVLSPFLTPLCQKNKCGVGKHTHGRHQEMVLIQLN